jgi:DNA topoisomerase-6 subunit B
MELESTDSKQATKVESQEKPAKRGATAEDMAARQRDISVAEFFTKNRHLLGFDSPLKSLLTAVKEAVDNSLDACEEAGIPPDVLVELHELAENRYRMVVEDNGPGILPEQVGKVFGKLLYGSKFHKLSQSRGQQGIGISAAGMYGMLTTGKPMKIISKPGKRAKAHEFLLSIDTTKNKPDIHEQKTVEWDKDHGTRVEIEMEAKRRKRARWRASCKRTSHASVPRSRSRSARPPSCPTKQCLPKPRAKKRLHCMKRSKRRRSWRLAPTAFRPSARAWC